MKPSAAVNTIETRPLSALISQALVAFTLELDNEFERRTSASGYPSATLSLVLWLTVMRLIVDGPLSVHDLATKAVIPVERLKFILGCLERWRLIHLSPDPAVGRPILLSCHKQARREMRDGWGSGRGIRADWNVRLTVKGLKAAEIWRPLPSEIEQRWQDRFGRTEVADIRDALKAIVGQLDVELPQGLYYDWRARESDALPARASREHDLLPFATLLSQALMAFAFEFDREAPAPLALSANLLRVLSDKPVRAAEIPRLTGGSPETSGVGWEAKPYVVVEPDPVSNRGKIVRLTVRGLKAQQVYTRLVNEIEKRWQSKFGQDEVRQLRKSLENLFYQHVEDRPLMALGLAPSPGTVRAGGRAVALGRREEAAAAKKRGRELVMQSEVFQKDPASALPHFPLWDMNRGFGP